MHWFWRAAIAAGVTYVVQHAVSLALFVATRPASVPVSAYLQAILQQSLMLPVFLPIVALPIPIYLALTRRFGPPQTPNETLCRECGYILRGISEPRCPECGERI